MCGIFGLVAGSLWNTKQVKRVVNDLFLLSETRGREASGIAIRTSKELLVLKEPVTASSFVKSTAYSQIYAQLGDNLQNFSIIGHCRLATNGQQESNLNNHPVTKNGGVGVHNGIIVNVDDLYDKFDFLNRDSEVDTELFIDLLQHLRQNGMSLPVAVGETYSSISGETSIAVLFDDISEVLLATNTGSIYYVYNNGLTIFASEKYILKTLLLQYKELGFSENDVAQLRPGYGAVVDFDSVNIFPLLAESILNMTCNKNRVEIIDYSKNEIIRSKSGVYNRDNMMKLIQDQSCPNNYITRCTQCLLPNTFPFIEFDAEGVCNYCRKHSPYVIKGEDELRKLVEPYRNNNGEPDCLVGFSGGRDSCYMLHYLKTELGMNPIAFTYDWGMVTDLARRNQARMCGKLGIEHIWISADIHQKRENIRKNIEAWLSKPALGMVPLLMAGDKQFYYYAHKVMEQTGVKLIFSGANFFEKTDFKTGFCGIQEGKTRDKGLLTGISFGNKLKLFLYYGYNFITNLGYWNTSLLDTLYAFYCSYILPDAYTYFYNYVQWDEGTIVNILKNEYDWETAQDTEATWRIGDGTAAFYNYIYYTKAGFSEFDTFRSNQIREGLISRNEGMKLINKENEPRYESLRWYSNIIGFNLNNALKIINESEKLYY